MKSINTLAYVGKLLRCGDYNKNTEVIYVKRYLIAHGPTIPECFRSIALGNIQLI
jgi:hypothetical protein